MKNFLLKLWHQSWFLFIAALIALGICLNAYVAMQTTQQKPSASPQPTSVYTVKPNHSEASKSITLKSVQPTSSPKSTPTNSTTLLGHFPYQEGDFSKMFSVGSYAQGKYQRFEHLMPEASLALMKLISAARNEGAWIIPVSCFRNLDDQRKLFEAQIQSRGSPQAAAKFSAPAGYSEHHTGYALDIADGHFPNQDISLDFIKTEAFKWMKLHAKEFGFELSFPENNSQGINYEPWHWRFIGTPEASKIFGYLL